MAYAILVAALPVQDGTIAWPFRIQLADRTADVLNPSVDFAFAAFWVVAVKIQLKVSTGLTNFQLQSADVLAGTGNVNIIAGSTAAGTPSAATPWMFGTSLLGTTLLTGWFPRSQQFMNIDLTTTAAATYDAEVWATPTR
jgi:hypothetical protein